MGIAHLRVPASKLTAVCSPEDLGFETTDEVEPLKGTIGQERAMSALELALDIGEPGFNLFVSGWPGTGRNTALRTYVKVVAARKPTPPDWGYVYNFQDPPQPLAISLPCGMMKELANDMDDLVNSCRAEIPKAFESDEYTHRMEEVMADIESSRQEKTGQMEKMARKAGFAITSTALGISPVPMKEGRPISQEEFQALSQADRNRITKGADKIQHSIAHAMTEIRRLRKEAQQQAKAVDMEVVRFTLAPIIDELQAKYDEHQSIVSYLDRVETDMIEQQAIFKPKDEEGPRAPSFPGPGGDEDVFVRYRVNDIVDNSSCDGAPVIFEYSPTYYNVFGRIDYKARVGTLTTDLTMIKAGAIHRANGGFLVLQARDLLAGPLSWETLKRTLRSGEISIENMGEQYSPSPSTSLRPQPIPYSGKIVVVGTPEIMGMLQAYDEDFGRYFKVTADFDTLMNRTPENLAKYAAFVAARCREGDLRPFHKTAVAGVIDYSSRLVSHQEKLTTRFMDVADIITEANYWAGKADSEAVMGEHVAEAIEQHKYRSNLTEYRLQEMIEEGTIQIATDGKVVGQLNGLSVLSLGDYTFGKPSRITARVSLGRGQVTNIERETRLSGKIHDKGFMTLNGYLQGQYGYDKPLSLSASIGFEQTYAEVDGDSASSTELYALLSQLSELPIAQGIAVTGSMNQNGEVQAIGGVNEKIEGFFDLCKARGLTGKQGVIVPRDNLIHLVLKEEVVRAVRRRRFHIYGVSTVDEGMEVLTGAPAGGPSEDGTYPKGTIHFMVERRLWEMTEAARAFSGEHDVDSEDSQDSEETEDRHEDRGRQGGESRSMLIAR